MRIRQTNRRGARWGVLGVALFLAGCGSYYAPTPVKYGDPRQAPTRAPSAYVPPVPSESQPYAARTDSEAVRAWPSTGVVVVEPGDTLNRISRRYGVPEQELVRLNGLTRPYYVAPGRKLRLPGPKVHTVQRGETVYGIAQRYRVAQTALVRLNGIAPPYRLAVGQRLKIPAPETPATKPVVTASLPSETSRAKMPPPQMRAPIEPQRTAIRPAPPRSARGFRWPLKGKILLRFGDRGKGLHNDGINIAAKRGAAVRAAENGVVAYAGNELRGFGNLILLKHSGGWTSAYAHNSRLLVRAGQRVRRGQVIARVGSTGSVNRPQLHFELRRGDNAVDPAKYLGRRPARTQRISRASVPNGRRDPG